jgi:hypothetical protein
MNSVELENAIAYFEKAKTKISFELTASEATDVRIALGARMIHIWEMENIDYETKKVNNDYIQAIYDKFITE